MERPAIAPTSNHVLGAGDLRPELPEVEFSRRLVQKSLAKKRRAKGWLVGVLFG